MKHISKDAYMKNDSALVLQLSSEAKQKKAKGIKVVDATIGMLFEDDESLSSFSLMNKALKNEVNANNRKYTGVGGNLEFQTNLINWIFKEDIKTSKIYNTAACATMGGTGAIMVALRNYIDKTSEVLIPDVGWANYVAISEEIDRKYSFYELFKDNKFNLKGIKDSVLKSVKKYKRATIIINDPCHNPSGYSISKLEWEDLVKFFNNINKKYPLTLVLDAAYMDYSDDSRVYFKTIKKIKAKYLTLVAFSASKTLSVYGLRLGGLVAISETKEDIADFKLASIGTSRATWSSPNAYVIAAFNRVLGNKKNYKLFEQYRKKEHKLLDIRYKKSRKFFDKLIIGGKPLPYKEGFFLTYKVNNANKLADKLKAKNIYVLPMKDKYIRIATCSLTSL